MKTIHIRSEFVALFVIVIATFDIHVCKGAGTAAAVPRSALAVRTNVPPTIDGLLTDPCWRHATANAGFTATNSAEKADPDTCFFVAYDKQALYLAIQVSEPVMDQIVAQKRHQDDNQIWRDDVVEVFLQPNPEQGLYYHLTVNPCAAQSGAVGLDNNVHVNFAAAATMDKDHWTVEIAMPFASMKVAAPRDGAEMRFNVCRERQEGATAAKAAQNSAWSYLTVGFHEQADFGYLVFADYNSALTKKVELLKNEIATLRQILPLGSSGDLTELNSRLILPTATASEDDFRAGLRLIKAVETDLSALLDKMAALPAGSRADLEVSHLDPYDSIAKDRLDQLIYYVKAGKHNNEQVRLDLKQAVNEYEHDGFAISSKTGISGLRIGTSGLTGPEGKSIPASDVKCSVVEYLNPTADRDFNYAAWNKIPAPDLVEEVRHPISLNPFESKQIWVTVHSANSAPGDYRGTIDLSDNTGSILRKIPIRVEVWPLVLPVRPALDLYLFTGVPWGGKSGELWADFMTDHYVSYAYMELPTDITVGGKPVKHQGREVKDLDLGYDIAGQVVKIPGTQWDNFERLQILHAHGIKLNFETGEGLLPPAILPDFIKYLAKAGFGYDDFRYKISDEDMSPWTLPIFKAYQSVDPKMRKVLCPAGSWDISPYAPYVDTYMCSVSVTAWNRWLKSFQEAKAHDNKKFSIYTNYASWAGRAPLRQIRSDLGFIWKIKASEFAVWTSGIYPPLNYVYPYGGAKMADVRDLTPEEQTTAGLIYFRNEDGIMYPVSCKRLEAIRDGVKDWMYLTLVSDLLRRSKDILPAAVQARYQAELSNLVDADLESEADFNQRKMLLANTVLQLQAVLRNTNRQVPTAR